MSLDDPALLNALMHTLAFAVNGNVVDPECLEYKGKAIKYLNDKLCRSEGVVTEATITTILLLAGVEVCDQHHTLLTTSVSRSSLLIPIVSRRIALPCSNSHEWSLPAFAALCFRERVPWRQHQAIRILVCEKLRIHGQR
jgi:hypothetical protein